MINRRRPRFRFLFAIAAPLLASVPLLALNPAEWSHRQSLPVPAAGLVQVTLSDATLDAAAPGQQDLRVLDPAGHEVALLVDRPSTAPARQIAPHSFSVNLTGGVTTILIATGTDAKLSSLLLRTPSPYFLRGAQVDISNDQSTWTTLESGAPIFRQWGAEKLDLPLGGKFARFVRVTISDRREPSIVFTGAELAVEAGAESVAVPTPVTIARRDEFAGETVLTVELAARQLPLANLAFTISDPLFLRRVRVSVRGVADAITTDQTIANGAIFRIALDGQPPRENLTLPLIYTPASRELLVHIYNGDSPPLTLASLQAGRVPVSVVFLAPAAGNYIMLSGNPQAAAPHYDLAGFAPELRTGHAQPVTPLALEDTPGYQPATSLASGALPDVPLAGAPLDTRSWSTHRAVKIDQPGIQELELDLPALAGAQTDAADLRLLAGGSQVPYILERPALARPLPLHPEPVADATRPSISRWKIKLPEAGLPLRSVTLVSSTPLFQRHFRLYERPAATDAGEYEVTLAAGDWSRTPEPGARDNHVLKLTQRLRTDTLWLETDNGDNPPIALTAAQATYPVIRLVFKVASTDGCELAYGNDTAMPPRYDLGLVAARLLTPARQEAHLLPPTDNAASHNFLASVRGGYIFWGALALVVIALLAVMAKLLPKPAA